MEDQQDASDLIYRRNRYCDPAIGLDDSEGKLSQGPVT